MISFDPSEEQQMIVNTASKLATAEIRTAYRECDETGEVPAALVDLGWGLGLVSGGIPEEHGGGGGETSALTGALLAEELAWGDLAIAMYILCPSNLVIPLLECGSAAQRQAYLPLFCSEIFKAASAALIEPRFDFDPLSPHTTATPDGGDYLLQGQKCYVPLAAEAEVLLVYAVEDGSVQGFIVERGQKGLEIGEREKNMGIKALPTYEVALNGCRVARSSRLGEAEGCHFPGLLDRSRVALSAMAVGVARAAYEYARDYALQRQAFGEAIAQRQAIAFMLAEMAIEIDATRLMTWEAAWRIDRGEDATREASLVKAYADDTAVTVTDRAVQVLGGHGYIRDHPVELWLRNGRGFVTFDGMAMV